MSGNVYSGPERRAAQPHDGWHLKREIQLGHLITTLTVAISAIVYIQRLEQRIALVEAAVVAQHDRDQRQDQATAEAVGLMRRQLELIDAKLDRLLVLDRAGRP